MVLHTLQRSRHEIEGELSVSFQPQVSVECIYICQYRRGSWAWAPVLTRTIH